MSIDDIISKLEEKVYSTGEIDSLMVLQSTSLIGRIGSVILGLLSMIIMITVPFIISLEILYICFPVIREQVDKLIVHIEGKGYKVNIAGITLRDAIEAVTEAETISYENRSALWIYLKIKCRSLMFVSFVVVFVIRGSSSVVALVDRLFGPVIQTLFG